MNGGAILGTLRQLRHPSEFRIAPPALETADVEALERIAALLQTPPASAAGSASIVKPVIPPAIVTGVATSLWRLRQKMVEPGTDRPLEEMRRAFRHLQSAWDALADSGVEIQDHTGAAFDIGQSLHVIAFQPTPGLHGEQVIETIKPSVYYGGRMVQMGEVIVGTPPREE
ncbi:MAG TPA: hypothetical protein VM557_11455 [Thermoanaerobaculia bacterium]|nr:hypothetical protein [Thermoanaerobaculia bacterium]